MLRHGASSLLRAAQRYQTHPRSLQALCLSCTAPDLETRHEPSLSRGFATVAEADAEDLVEPSERVKQIAEDIMHLNLLEVADLTDILQKRLGIDGMPMGMGYGASMPGSQQATAAAPAQAAAAPAVEEKTSFDVKLDGFDAAAKIKVIKEIRAITELGLKEAKELVEKSPVLVKAGLKKEEAEELKKKLESVGGKISLE